MDVSNSSAPSKITDEVYCNCSKCGKTIYKETIVGILDKQTEEYTYTKYVQGNFKQSCDSEGIPSGAVIPFCNCKEN